jgi:DNA polymerase III alpha subunit
MIPIFKSTYSIGKSILTLDHPDKVRDDGPDSIFSIAKDNKLSTIYLVEDSMVGFFDAFKKCQDLGIQLCFGYRFTCCNDYENKDSNHKLIAFAKNDQGCKDLNRFYSFVNTQRDGRISDQDLVNMWTENMLLVVPFYDSFIFNNHFCLGNCIPDFKSIPVLYFIERNNLPFESMIEKAVREYASKHSIYKPELVKSIYYRYKSDVEAFQTYKILCNRSFGRQATLSSPNLNHFGSDEFCWESFQEQ